MTLSIAKFLIQYFYDSAGSHAASYAQNVDPLPRWLRNWTNRDLHLAEFERELRQLESHLISKAGAHLETWRCSTTPAEFSLLAQSKRSVFMASTPIALAVLAAGLSCVLLAAGWFYWQPGLGNGIKKSDFTLNETKPSLEPSRRDQLVLSTWEATKRIASDLKQKGSQANHTLALVNQSELDMQFRDATCESLRFVAQKLPQATVRMFGMNAANRH